MKLDNKPATIVDVANLANVSVSTVSRVANGYQHVSPKLRSRVQKAMDELGFQPNRQAQKLVKGKSKVVGLMVHALGTEYIAEIIRGIDEALIEADYDIMLYTTHRQQVKEESYSRSIANNLADGLILVVPTVATGYIETLYEANYPHVIVDVDAGNGKNWSVGVTNWQGAYDAIHYLLELNHRRIAIITDVMELSTSSSRLAGYRSALEEYGIEYDSDLVKEDNYLFPNTRKLTEELLKMSDPPTAIFTTGDLAAIRVMETLRLYGKQIPHDMSIIGFDDIPRALTVYPRLTTVRHPMYQMGQEAVHLLLQQINTPELPPQHIQLETQLITRESCLPLSPQ